MRAPHYPSWTCDAQIDY